MEGPTSSGGSRNRLTCLNLQEHDDDDDIQKLGVELVCDLAVKLELTFYEWRPCEVNKIGTVGTNINRFWNS
jgi:hypothetical protein